MSDTARLKLPLLAAAQAQKHITVNEALGRLDALVQARVASRYLDAPPAAPAEGECWIVGGGGTGEWAGMGGRLVQRFAAGWTFHQPEDGWLAFVEDEGRLVVRTGGAWLDLADGAVYFPAGDGVQLKLNKPAAADTASVLLQTGFSGRAEIGLAGDDDLSLKVSLDGATWIEAMRVDRASGRAVFPAGASRSETLVFTSSGPWVRPAWARVVMAVVIGAGGGGGSGRLLTTGGDRRGGSGGGAGGFARMTFAAPDLPAVVDVEVGVGGLGGAAVTAASGEGFSGLAGGPSGLRDGANFMLYAGGGKGGVGAKVGTIPSAQGGSGSFGFSGSGALGAAIGTSALEPTHGHAPGAGGGGSGLTIGGTIYVGGSGASGCLVVGPGDRAAPGGVGGGPQTSGDNGSPKGWIGGAGGGGGGGGGGDAVGLVAAGSGGHGGAPGGGGGGGGGATNGAVSGAGGNGGHGEVVLIVLG